MSRWGNNAGHPANPGYNPWNINTHRLGYVENVEDYDEYIRQHRNRSLGEDVVGSGAAVGPGLKGIGLLTLVLPSSLNRTAVGLVRPLKTTFSENQGCRIVAA